MIDVLSTLCFVLMHRYVPVHCCITGRRGPKRAQQTLGRTYPWETGGNKQLSTEETAKVIAKLKDAAKNDVALLENMQASAPRHQ